MNLGIFIPIKNAGICPSRFPIHSANKIYRPIRCVKLPKFLFQILSSETVPLTQSQFIVRTLKAQSEYIRVSRRICWSINHTHINVHSIAFLFKSIKLQLPRLYGKSRDVKPSHLLAICPGSKIYTLLNVRRWANSTEEVLLHHCTN